MKFDRESKVFTESKTQRKTNMSGSILQALAARATRMNEEKKQLEADVKAFAEMQQCTAADFKGIDAVGFRDLEDILRNAFDISGRYEKAVKWQTCYDEAQLHEPDQLPMLLDTKTLSQRHATLKKVPLLALLRENPKSEWCEVVSRLGDLHWTAAEIAQFPIALCRLYIEKIGPDDVRRVYSNDEYPRQPIWLTAPEKLLCHLLRTFYPLLTKEERVEAAIAIDRCSVQSCPLGSKVRVFYNNAACDGQERMDLLRHIVREYQNDPLSLTCETFRTLIFRGSWVVETYGVGRPDECSPWDKLTYYFPDLCYVFPTTVKVRYHQQRFASSTHSDCRAKKTEVTVNINRTRRVPDITSWALQKTSGKQPRTCWHDGEMEEKTIVLDGSVCKSVHIDVPSGCDIHEVNIYGDMLLLF